MLEFVIKHLKGEAATRLELAKDRAGMMPAEGQDLHRKRAKEFEKAVKILEEYKERNEQATNTANAP
jgi:hypothetical protein